MKHPSGRNYLLRVLKYRGGYAEWIIISAVALLTVIAGFFMFYRPAFQTDEVGSEVSNTARNL